MNGTSFGGEWGYPELTANANFMQLQNELSDTENKNALSRQFYNDTVLKYNNAIEMFSASLHEISVKCTWVRLPSFMKLKWVPCLMV